MADLSTLQRRLSACQTAAVVFERQIIRQQEELASVKADIAVLDEVLTVYAVCLKEQADIRTHIEGLLTLLLQALFDDSFEFKFELQYKEDGTLSGMEPMVYEAGVPSEPRKNGGGLVNILSTGMRIIWVLVHSHPVLAPIIILDEPMSNMDANRWRKLIEVLIELQAEVPFQFLTITHAGNGDVDFPTMFEVTRPAKISQVTKIAA